MSEIPNQRTTSRGFKVHDEFVDLYGTIIRVQNSSIADQPAVWIFANKSGVNDAAHLSVEMAKRVRDALDVFIAEAS